MTQERIQVDLGDLKEVEISVFNRQGTSVHHQNQFNGANYKFDLKGALGIYFLEINSTNKKGQFKLLKN